MYEDDELLRGVTLPNAKIVLYVGELSETKTRTTALPEGDLVGQADSEGRIKLNVTSLKIKDKKKLTVIVLDEEQNKAIFSLAILPKREVTLETTNTKELAKTSTGKELPKTGEKEAASIMLSGIVILGICGTHLIKRKIL